jgi:hypothetical protein
MPKNVDWQICTVLEEKSVFPFLKVNYLQVSEAGGSAPV